VKREELAQAILQTLTSIAPEVDPGTIEPAKLLREQVDLDSADWLNFLVALHAKLGIDIPDADVGKLTTLDRLVDYCEQKLAA
jgi:acyl carrier protein